MTQVELRLYLVLQSLELNNQTSQQERNQSVCGNLI